MLLDCLTLQQEVTKYAKVPRSWSSWSFNSYFAPKALKGVSSSQAGSMGRSFMQTANLSGDIVTPGFPFKLGSSAPSGREISKRCIIEEKKEKSSMRASTLPRHILRPTPNGIKYSGFWTFPSALMKRFGLNSLGLSHRFGSMCTVLMSGTTWLPAGILKPQSVSSL